MPNPPSHSLRPAASRPRGLTPLRATVLPLATMGQSPYSASEATHGTHRRRSVHQSLRWLERSCLVKSELLGSLFDGYQRRYFLTPVGALTLRQAFEHALGGGRYQCVDCHRTGLTADDMMGKRGRPVVRCQKCQLRRALAS